MKTKEHRHQRGRALSHGRVDHLSSAEAFRFQQRTHHAERQTKRAAAEIAYQIQWLNRRFARHLFLPGAVSDLLRISGLPISIRAMNRKMKLNSAY
jgi:hypothetical protein